MFGITPIRGQGEYYLGLAAEDYYLAGGEPPGRWVGRGAVELGVSGRVRKEEFRALLQGFSPRTHGPMVQNAGDESRRPGWDLTFSAPKSVSVLWSQLEEGERRVLQGLQQRAVEAALSYLESEAAWTRTGWNGTRWERAQLAVATFEHGTSRAQDPQLHTHCVLLNVGVREDGSTSALETRPLYLHQHQADALYRTELAAGIARDLGYRVERTQRWFEVAGVSSTVLAAFSQRRTEILQALAEREARGLSGDPESAQARESAALATRAAKEQVPRKELFAIWQARAAQLGFSAADLPRLSAEERVAPARRQAETTRELLTRALAEVTREQASFRTRDLVRAVAQEALSTGLGAGAVRAGVAAYLEGRGVGLERRLQVVRLGTPPDHEPRFATREVVALERAMLARVLLSKERGPPLSEAAVRAAESKTTLTEEQRAALWHLTRTPGLVKVLVGRPGTGKSFLLAAVREAFACEGYTVLGAALAGKAASGLQASAQIPSTTLHELLFRLDAGSAATGWALTAKTLIVVDEAAMASNAQIARLIQRTTDAGARLLLVGDAKQLQAIEQGGAFRGIAARLGAAELTTLRRQVGEDAAWQKDAIGDFGEGRAEAALRAYQARGRVLVTNTARQARTRAVMDWETGGGAANPEQHLLLAGTRSDAALLNQNAQAVRARRGFLGGEELWVGPVRFHVGDRVLFTRNARVLGVENGNLGTVLVVDARRGIMTVHLDKGRVLAVNTELYPHLELGYALTAHKGQGITAPGNVHVVTAGLMQDLHLTYVEASRARGATRFYAPKAEAGEELARLIRQMSRSREKELAHDVRAKAGPPRGHETVHEHVLEPV